MRENQQINDHISYNQADEAKVYSTKTGKINPSAIMKRLQKRVISRLSDDHFYTTIKRFCHTVFGWNDRIALSIRYHANALHIHMV